MSPIFTSEIVEEVIRWLHEAGQIALKHFDGVGPIYKPDHTFVTKADLEVEGFLTERIRQMFPMHGLVAEESASKRLGGSSDITWVIDPLDGTTAFTQGLPGWGIAIGILVGGKPTLGFYYMPLLRDLTYTTAQGQVYGNGRLLTPSLHTHWEQKGFLAVTASVHVDYQINTRFVRALGSHGTNLIYTARGSASAAFLPKAHVWDLVAGAAIIEQLGGQLRYLDGSAVDYEVLVDGRLAPQPIIAAHPQLLETLPHIIQLRKPSV